MSLAQAGDLARGESTGIRQSARLLDEPVPGIARLAPTAEPPKFIGIPSLVIADGAKVGAGSLAYITRVNPNVPLQVRVGYGRLVIDDGDDKDRVSVYLSASSPRRRFRAASVFQGISTSCRASPTARSRSRISRPAGACRTRGVPRR